MEEPASDDRAEQWRLRCHLAAVDLARYADREVLHQQRIHDLQCELDEVQRTLEAVLSSRSWALTAPLRRTFESLRGSDEPDSSDHLPQENRAQQFERRMNLAYEARRSAWPQPEPTTLNEKIWHRRATDRRPILKTYCDKVASLELVEDRLPAEVLPERLEVADSFAELERGHLPRECVIKVSHASGGSFVVWDGPASAGQGFDAWVRRAFRSGDVPWTQVDHEISQALDHDYGWEMLEWGYLDLPRMVVVDRLYRAADGGLPPDLMMFVFHGQVEVVRINADRQREQRGPGTTYDRNWSPLPIDTRAPRGDYPRPVELDLAIELAEALCPDEEMARVDFLLTADGLRFGEITAYHLGGNAEFRLEWADRYLGSLW